jgi:hypothetical protein
MTAERREARRHLERLGLEPGATVADIKAAHRELVRRWHPDRFEADTGRRTEAEERIKGINAAYTWILQNRRLLDRFEPAAPPRPRRRVRLVRWGLPLAALVGGATWLAVTSPVPSRRSDAAALPAAASRRVADAQELQRLDFLLREADRRSPSVYVQAARVNVRSLPGSDGEVVAVLERGERVRSVERSAGWVAVARPGSGRPLGWVPAYDLDAKPPADGR